MSNEIYKQLSQPPKDALKVIGAGRLKGKSDINPQWRYEAMTNVFGVCGIGWKFEIDSIWIDEGSHEQKVQNVKVLLYVKINDVWSEPIPGVGGSMLVVKEKAGLHTNDEAVKMAITDALSTSMKMLGVAADIYRGAWDGSNYRVALPGNDNLVVPKAKRKLPDKPSGADIKFYQEMGVFKEEFGEEEYKKLLGSNGYESCQDIPIPNRKGALTNFAGKLKILKEEGGR
jgi:hypothetical protein